jgi:OmpA-OmpF porin, OOP family
MMKKIATALLLSSVIAAPAFAADEGFYAGLSLGRSSLSTPSGTVLTKKRDTVYGFLAGYQFNQNWGVEAQYGGAGKFATTTFSGKADTFSVAAIGTLPMSDSVSLYGKLGYANTKSKVSGTTYTGATRGAATYGLGVQYNATPAVGIRFGWDRYGATINDAAGAKHNFNSDVVGVAAVVKF